jgi:diaminopimelate decarboxylase
MPTPAYIVVADRLLENYYNMQKRMKPCEIAYSMKANPCFEVAQILANTDTRYEVCSLKDAIVLNDIGVTPDKYYCGAVVMTEAEISALYKIGCRIFTYDTIEQLRRIRTVCKNNVMLILRLRVNDIVDGAIGYGMPSEQIINNPQILMDADCISFHISDHHDMTGTFKAITKCELLMQMENKISFLNIGGSYTLNGDETTYHTLRSILERIREQYSIRIICEPGSALVDTAVDALVICVMVQEQNGFFDIFLDGGIPSGMTRKANEIINLTEYRPSQRHIYRFFDTTSMKRLLFQTRLNIELHNGDLLLFRNYGAYSYCYSNIFHSRSIPAVYMIKENSEIESLVSRISTRHE